MSIIGLTSVFSTTCPNPTVNFSSNPCTTLILSYTFLLVNGASTQDNLLLTYDPRTGFLYRPIIKPCTACRTECISLTPSYGI